MQVAVAAIQLSPHGWPDLQVLQQTGGSTAVDAHSDKLQFKLKLLGDPGAEIRYVSPVTSSRIVPCAIIGAGVGWLQSGLPASVWMTCLTPFAARVWYVLHRGCL